MPAKCVPCRLLRPLHSDRCAACFKGYLSRSLSQAGLHVLALDADASQTRGAERRDKCIKKPHRVDYCSHSLLKNHSGGSLTHVTCHITPSSLNSSVSSWVHDLGYETDEPVSVLFVGLHACGTLTLDIFRAFLSHHTSSRLGDPHEKAWMPAGAVVIGCCYNRMSLHGMNFLVDLQLLLISHERRRFPVV